MRYVPLLSLMLVILIVACTPQSQETTESSSSPNSLSEEETLLALLPTVGPNGGALYDNPTMGKDDYWDNSQFVVGGYGYSEIAVTIQSYEQEDLEFVMNVNLEEYERNLNNRQVTKGQHILYIYDVKTTVTTQKCLFSIDKYIFKSSRSVETSDSPVDRSNYEAFCERAFENAIEVLS